MESVNRRRRRSPRLQGYDYAQAGAYFITICTHNRQSMFGQVCDGVMELNETGRITEECWFELPRHFPLLELDAWVVMPNHVHGIILLITPTPTESIHPPKLSSVINSYKGAVTRREHQLSNRSDFRIWQGRYYDHIIRSEADLNRIRAYVANNPMHWAEDSLYSAQ